MGENIGFTLYVCKILNGQSWLGTKKTSAEIIREIAVLLPRYKSAKKNCLLNKTQHT